MIHLYSASPLHDQMSVPLPPLGSRGIVGQYVTVLQQSYTCLDIRASPLRAVVLEVTC